MSQWRLWCDKKKRSRWEYSELAWLHTGPSFADQGFGLSPEFDVVLSSGNDETPMPPTHADLTHGFAINPQVELS